MKNKLLVIINPISGTGKQKGIDKMIKDRLDSDKYDVEITYTEYAGHASLIAKEAVDKSFDTVAVVGGDGTVNEVVKSLIDTDVTLAIIPCGSGNGLARHLGIPMNTKKAIDSVNTFIKHQIDTLSINEHKCVNVAGFGFDALISYEFANMTKRGIVSYFKSVVSNYFTYKNQNYTVEMNGETHEMKAFLFSIANSSQYGNNAYIAPSARIDDGLVDIVAIRKPYFFQIPTVALSLFTKCIDNTFVCKTLEGSEFTIKHDNKIAHIDGEPLELGKVIKVKVNPRSLNILVKPNRNI
ncbi:MAG: diacylglycerol kinase family protein [Marinifilaceae bacterium]